MTPLQRAAKQVGEIQKILSTEELTLGKRRYLESELFVLCENIAECCLSSDPDDGIDWSGCPDYTSDTVPEPNYTTFYCSEMTYKLHYKNDEGEMTYDDHIPPDIIEQYYDKISEELSRERPISYTHPKIIEIIPGVELHDGSLYGTLSVAHYVALTQREINDLREALAPIAMEFDDWLKFRSIGTDGGDLLVDFYSGEEMLDSATIFENRMYVRRHSAEFNTVRFYAHDDSDVLRMLYFNPDDDTGGQMVQNDLYIGMLQEALKECGEEQFWDRLDEQAKQYLTDIDSPDFAEEARFFIEEPYDFCGQDSYALGRIEAWVEENFSLEEDPVTGITM